MGGLFAPKTPAPITPPPPAAPIEQATFQAGGSAGDKDIKKKKLGKKVLQIPLGSVTASSGLNTGG